MQDAGVTTTSTENGDGMLGSMLVVVQSGVVQSGSEWFRVVLRRWTCGLSGAYQTWPCPTVFEEADELWGALTGLAHNGENLRSTGRAGAIEVLEARSSGWLGGASQQAPEHCSPWPAAAKPIEPGHRAVLGWKAPLGVV